MRFEDYEFLSRQINYRGSRLTPTEEEYLKLEELRRTIERDEQYWEQYQKEYDDTFRQTR